jgi:hypothetical protein
MMFDDDGTGNTGIEIVRLNKKFDIFMKRFARAEEDIKEVKQNFYRVMHCAFAKYEQGFKRKNEYLEKRKFRNREAIERGVENDSLEEWKTLCSLLSQKDKQNLS